METFTEDTRAVRGGESAGPSSCWRACACWPGTHAYLNAIVDYNQAQLELYVALGQPPADVLARPVPARTSSRRRRVRATVIAATRRRRPGGARRADEKP